jgi:CubicO group peptidase (beta-lactamase class C family)
MKKIILILISGLLTACGTDNTLMNEKANADDREAWLDRILAPYNGPDVPGAALMIIEDGRPIVKKGYGIANFANHAPVTSQTDFRLASVTKQFTAMCILQLVEKGDLSLDTSLTDIFPGFPDYGKTITVRHLLQHTSGLQDYEELMGDDYDHQITDNEVLQIMMAVDSPYFPAGEKYQYSNTGYAVLTQVLEKITGQPFREYLQQNVFGPAGMSNTLAYVNGVNVVPNRAYGYTIEDDGTVIETDQSSTSAVLGDGGIYSNLDDFFKWDQVLYTDRLLSQPYMDLYFRENQTTDGKDIGYAFGWRREKYKGLDIIFHTGSSIGFRNIFYRVPARHFSVVLFTNRDEGGEFTTLETAHKIVDIYLEE